MFKKEINGYFDGQNMVANTGEIFPIPPNYASKSKLIEGDGLILKITDDGKFIFKQVDLQQRERVIADIIEDEMGKICAYKNGKFYKLLDASVSFFKLKAGDKAVILVPQNRECSWGAIEYIMM